MICELVTVAALKVSQGGLAVHLTKTKLCGAVLKANKRGRIVIIVDGKIAAK